MCGCWLTQAFTQQVSKEGWSVVHAHLLVVQGEAEEQAAPAVMTAGNGPSSTCLPTGHVSTLARATQQCVSEAPGLHILVRVRDAFTDASENQSLCVCQTSNSVATAVHAAVCLSHRLCSYFCMTAGACVTQHCHCGRCSAGSSTVCTGKSKMLSDNGDLRMTLTQNVRVSHCH